MIFDQFLNPLPDLQLMTQPVWQLRRCQTFIILLFNLLTDCYCRRLCDPDTMSVQFFRTGGSGI